jgi:predicted ATP-grasp superfamily ATP-dependent carboligase
VATSNEPTRVLVAVDEGTGSVATVRALRAGGYEPWAAFHQAATYALRSRAVAGRLPVPSPEVDADAYATALARAAEASEATVVLPASESALRALTGREARFPEGVIVAVCAPEALERATDKEALAEQAATAGLMTPPSVTVGRYDGLGPALDIGFPALVKPARSVTVVERGLRVRDAELVRDAGELEAAVAAAPGARVVVQRQVAGRLTAVTGVAWEGDVVCTSHQVAHRIWPPVVGVTCMGEVVPPDPALDAGVRRLIGGLGWSGIFQTQFIRGTDGLDYLIDLNPRVYGSLALAVAAGANLPAMWVDLLLGRRPDPAPARVGTRYRVEEDDVRALVAAFRAGRRREALRGLLPRRRTVHAVFSLRDAWPSTVSIAKLLGRGRQRKVRKTSRAISAQSS